MSRKVYPFNPTVPARPPSGDVADPELAGLHPELAAAVKHSRRVIRLTDRWTKLDPHPQQSLFFYHPSRFKVCPAGRRSGKTELAKRKSVLQLIRRRPLPAKVFTAAPSLDHARDIFWDDFLAMVPPAWIAKINLTRMEIITKWGAMLRVFGFDRPRRIEGVPWNHGTIDEIADCPPRCYKRHVQPAMMTRGMHGTIDLIGVPDEVGRNQAEYEELWTQGLTWPNVQDLCSFHWKSADIIPAETKVYADGADALTYAQEMEGQFVSSGGKAIYDFDNAYHVKADYAAYDPRLPLDWSLDFGVTPAVALLGQSWNGFTWIIDEIVINNGSTEAQVIGFRDRMQTLGMRPRRIRLFADPAGKGRHSPTGESDFHILERDTSDLPIEWRQLTGSTPIKNTLNAVRGRVKSKSGLVRLHVHPRCRRLIEDCKTSPWPDKLTKFHALAALRYYCYELYGDSSGVIGTTSLHLPNLGGKN